MINILALHTTPHLHGHAEWAIPLCVVTALFVWMLCQNQKVNK